MQLSLFVFFFLIGFGFWLISDLPTSGWSGFPHFRCSIFPGFQIYFLRVNRYRGILGDPGADSRGEGKSKWAEKYGKKKSKERRKEPLGTMSYQASSKRSPPFCLLIGQKNTKVFWHQVFKRFLARENTQRPPARTENYCESKQTYFSYSR